MDKLREILTKDDVEEIEQQATIGLAPDEHEEYERRFESLCKERRELKWQNILAPDLTDD